MMYPIMTLNDETEITHSEMLPDGRVRVYIEKPDEKDGFHNATCYLPKYDWTNIYGFTQAEIEYYHSILESISHIIIELSQEGGFDNAEPIQN